MLTHSAEPLRLHPLTYLPDGDDVVVGRLDTDSYGVFPPDGAELLRKLADGVPPDEAARWYEDTYQELVDLDEFLGVLTELDFLRTDEHDDVRPPRWQRLGRWTFSPAAFACYAALLAAAAVVSVVRPEVAPRPQNLLFTDYTMLIAATFFFGQFPFILFHESFHALAGRRLGLHSRLRLGRRLYFIVFETSLDGLVVLPRRRRYLPILAGIIADLLATAALTLVAATMLRPDGTLPLAGAMCLALAFATLLRLAWQFYFYLRTDLYVLVSTVLGCHDLQAAARRIMGNRVRRLLGRPTLDEEALHPRDRVIGRWYSWLVVAGYSFSIVVMLSVLLPILWQVLGVAVERLVGGGDHAWHEIGDSVIFLGTIAAQFGLAGYLAIRARRRRPEYTHLAS